MRWGARGLVLLLSATLAVSACSDDDDGGDAAASRDASSDQESSTSTTTSTTPTVPTTLASSSTASGKARTTPTTRRSAATATTTPPPPTTTTTIPPCGNTSGSLGDVPSFGDGPALVVLVNQHSASVVFGVAGSTHTLSSGGSKEFELDASGGTETITAAPASDPSKQFTFRVDLAPSVRYTLEARTLNQGEACAGRVAIAVGGIGSHS